MGLVKFSVNEYVYRMSEPEPKRSYTLKERARTQEETRQRIVEAAMHLHEELGPRATTIKAIAERAGVQRLTVYRHFEDDGAIFRACSGHYMALNPLPDPQAWEGIAEMNARRRAALGAFFAYYGRTQGMFAAVFRDLDDVPAMAAPVQEMRDAVERIARGLEADLGALGRATLRHLLDFRTWQALDAQGLDVSGMEALAMAWLDGARARDA